MKSIFALLSLLAAFAFSACSHTPIPAAGDYVVAELYGSPVNTPQPITVTFTGERLIGQGPINNWNVPVDENNEIGIGPMTRMAGPAPLMQLESQLMVALEGGTLTSRSDDVLVVVKNDHSVVVMTPVNPTTVTGTPSPTAIPEK